MKSLHGMSDGGSYFFKSPVTPRRPTSKVFLAIANGLLTSTCLHVKEKAASVGRQPENIFC